jgi:hypothetical protein
MKRLLFTILLFLSVFISNAQDTITYPHYSVENGKQVVVMTIEQAQKLDNDGELLKLFKQLNADFNSVDSACIKVVDAQGKEIAGLKVQISALQSLDKTKTEEITNLKSQVAEYKAKDALSKEELAKKDLIIGEKDEQIQKHKRQKIGGFIGGGAAIIVLLALLIL